MNAKQRHVHYRKLCAQAFAFEVGQWFHAATAGDKAYITHDGRTVKVPLRVLTKWFEKQSKSKPNCWNPLPNNAGSWSWVKGPTL